MKVIFILSLLFSLIITTLPLNAQTIHCPRADKVVAAVAGSNPTVYSSIDGLFEL